MRDIYATTMQLVHLAGGDAFETAAERALAWAWRVDRAMPNLLEEPAGRTPADARPDDTVVSWWSVPQGQARALELRLRHPDSVEETLTWLATITISDIEGATRATLRLERGASVHILRPWSLELRAPALVLEFMSTPLLAYAGSLELSPRPRILTTDGIESFVRDVLEAEGRALPILVASSGMYAPFVDTLARALAGLVQIVRAENTEVDDALRRRLASSGYVVPTGGLRLYWPGFGSPGSPRRHPYWTAAEIRRGRESGKSVLKHLINILAPISTGRVPADPGVLVARREWLKAGLVEERKREAAQRERARDERQRVAQALKAAHDAQDSSKEAEHLREQLIAVRHDLGEVEEERDVAITRAEEAAGNELKIVEESLAIEERSAVLGKLVAQLEDENAAIRSAFKTISDYQARDLETSHDDSGHASDVNVTTWDDLSTGLTELAGPGFVLTPQAESCATDSNRYPHPQTMWDALLALEQVGRAYNELGAELGKRFEDFAFEVGGIDVALQDSSYADDCIFEFDDQTYSRLPHVKIDDAKSPNEVGRIYFALDPDHNRLIVDWFGTKPDRPKASPAVPTPSRSASRY